MLYDSCIELNETSAYSIWLKAEDDLLIWLGCWGAVEVIYGLC